MDKNTKKVNPSKGLVVFLDQKLGEGSNGQVYRGQVGYQKPNAIDCAVKIIEKPQQVFFKNVFSISYQEIYKAKLEKELIIQKSIDHQGIIKCYDYQATTNNYYIFMELCQGKTLQDFIMTNETESHPEITKKISEQQVIELTWPIIGALHYLSNVQIQHKVNPEGNKGIAHRDLKPDNMMIENGQLKLIDFGLAKLFGDEKVTQFQGTPYYMSPQNLSSRRYSPEKNDVWSLGVILFQLLNGAFPWRKDVDDVQGLFQAIKSMKKLMFDEDISQEMQQLVRQMLDLDEDCRIDLNDIVSSPVYNKYFFNTVKKELFDMYDWTKSYIRQVSWFSEQQKQSCIQLVKSLLSLKMVQSKQSIQKSTSLEQMYDKLELELLNSSGTEQWLKIQLQQIVNRFDGFSLYNDAQWEGFKAIAQYWLEGSRQSFDKFLEKQKQ